MLKLNERKETVMIRVGSLRQKRKRDLLCKRIFSVASYLVLFMIIGLLVIDNNNLNEKMNAEIQRVTDEYTAIVDKKDSHISSLNDKIDTLNSIVGELNVTIEDLDKQLVQVSEVNQSYVDELNMFREREELYDKYEYAIIDDGHRSNLTYEQIKLGEELMADRGLNPHLMFGTIMVESNARPWLVNSSSGATGLGQFMNGTAKFVYEDLMGNGKGTYYSELRKDPVINIHMMAYYYDYLYDLKGTTFKVVKQYSGNSTEEGTLKYLSRVNKYTSKVGVIIE